MNVLAAESASASTRRECAGNVCRTRLWMSDVLSTNNGRKSMDQKNDGRGIVSREPLGGLFTADYERTGVQNIAGGALAELFEMEQSKIMENIRDRTTDAEEVRVLTLTVKYKSNESRTMAAIQVSAKSKLAGPKATGSIVRMAEENGSTIAIQESARQDEL